MKTELTTVDKIRVLLGKEVPKSQMNLATETLDEGNVTIEAEVFAEGEAVMIVNGEDRIPLPVGEYKLDNEMILKVEEEGVIASISEKQEEQQEQDEQVAASDDKTESPLPKAIIESITKETKFSKEDIELILSKIEEANKQDATDDKDAKIAELEAEITELKKSKETEEQKEEEAEEVELAAKPVIHNPEEKAKKEPVKLSRKKGQTTSQRAMGNIASVLNRK